MTRRCRHAGARLGGKPLADTPLLRALRAQQGTRRSRLHMPGHKGILRGPLREAARWDFTELPGTDSLYEAKSCLRELEEGYARLYGAGRSLLSAGGSTLCIQTMLALARRRAGNGRRAVVCPRTVHEAALHALGLLGMQPVWMETPLGENGLPRQADAQSVSMALGIAPDAAAVLLTSPDYYGQVADIGAIAKLCHARGVPLLVDGAHGAHLRFLRPHLHPMALGADACCDSLHKMLPALTGAAVLHLSRHSLLPHGEAKACMAYFGSTSPSYLIMLSADLLLGELVGGLPARLSRAAAGVAALRRAAGERGLRTAGDDPLRLTLPMRGLPLFPQRVRELLYGCGVEPEMCNGQAVVVLAGAHTSQEDFSRVLRALRRLPVAERERAARDIPPPPARVWRGAPPREAMLSPCETVPVQEALGRVACAQAAPCPPGIPIAVCGELMEKDTIFLLQSTGVKELDVVK